MSAWPGKFVIGLTGNIATGKSEVRKMLERLGANSIDADLLAHQVIEPGTTGYQAVIDFFGREILAPSGTIDRSKLATIVFTDPSSLAHLESIIHPLVGEEIDRLIKSSSSSVIVIEAIKLIEVGLHKSCDTLWVIFAPEEIQLARLIEKRDMSPIQAQQRITAQPPQQIKLAMADVIIRNDRSIKKTWQQVVSNWKKLGLPASH